MMIMYNDFYPPLEAGCFYHVFNQGNAKVIVFYKDDNYAYFLKKVDVYILDFVEVYAFCLLSNHFHMLIKLKAYDEIRAKAMKKKELKAFLERNIEKENLPGIVVSEMFRRFFMSYAKAINKQQNRTGSLFRKNFKRKKITDLNYLKEVVVYIHRNPQRHGFVNKFSDYSWSSYNRILEEKITKLKKIEVLEWFSDRDGFISGHQSQPQDFPSL
jgi:putative transposase